VAAFGKQKMSDFVGQDATEDLRAGAQFSRLKLHRAVVEHRRNAGEPADTMA